ncbi:MAG: hypothetical protein EPN99_03340 [Frankiales bacterium]|nr:MAG: hypothetical protein EPN99_03340 [Frankiales bacterium]
MTAVLDAPTEAAPAPRPASRRGTRALVALLALGAVALLVLAGFRAAQESVSFEPVTPVFGGSAPAVTLPSYGVKGMYVIGYEHGETARISLPIANDGPLPVTVRSLDLGGGVAPLLLVREVTGLPLSLRPGEEGVVEVIAELANCRFFHEREVQNLTSFQIGVSLLGQERTRVVEYDRPIMVHSPMLVGCPDRRLDREANDRSDLVRVG